MSSSGALSDTAPEGEKMAQKDWAGFSSAVHRGARSQNPLRGTNNSSYISLQITSKAHHLQHYSHSFGTFSKGCHFETKFDLLLEIKLSIL